MLANISRFTFACLRPFGFWSGASALTGRFTGSSAAVVIRLATRYYRKALAATGCPVAKSWRTSLSVGRLCPRAHDIAPGGFDECAVDMKDDPVEELGDTPIAEFREQLHKLADWVGNYRAEIAERPI